MAESSCPSAADEIAAAAAPPPGSSPASERRTSPVELLWDLVFVFAVTQVTTLLTNGPGWGRFGQGMLCLALVWWAWSAFVWAANAQAEDSGPLRACLLIATVLIFVCGLALPQAFGAEGLLFASSYAVVRLLHLAVYVDASRRGNASWTAIMGFAVTVLVGMALLIVGATALHGWARALLWTLAAAIDYAGPAWLTRERLRGLQQVAVDHFSERYGLFVLICLGESVVAVGAGAGGAHRHLNAELILGAALALLIAVGLWWTYFDRLADEASRRLRDHADPVLAAADGYSYLHLIIVAGVITYAGGVKLLVHPSAAGLPTAGRLALCGGVALYMAGVAAFGLRLTGRLAPGRLLLALALLAVFAAGAGLSATLITAIICALTLVLCASETISGRRSDGAGLQTTRRGGSSNAPR